MPEHMWTGEADIEAAPEHMRKGGADIGNAREAGEEHLSELPEG